MLCGNNSNGVCMNIYRVLCRSRVCVRGVHKFCFFVNVNTASCDSQKTASSVSQPGAGLD